LKKSQLPRKSRRWRSRDRPLFYYYYHILDTCWEPPEAHWSYGQPVIVQIHVTNFVVRAGQTKATRVVRLLAEGTIEASILKYQQRKLTAGGGSGSGIEEDSLLPQHGVDASTLATLMRDHPPPPTPAK
jgi:hypothetical protein